jgi:hypothetical protein
MIDKLARACRTRRVHAHRAPRLPLEARVVEHGDDTENAGRLTVAAGLAVTERLA